MAQVEDRLLDGVRTRLVRALASCTTEADLVQVLYAELHPALGYEGINLQVLEREGWYHSVRVDRGVLQDLQRRRLEESSFAPLYLEPRLRVLDGEELFHVLPSRGPGGDLAPRRVIWVPILHGGQVLGAVTYQLHQLRPVADEELALLEQVHDQLSVLVRSAQVNELARDQAMSLDALNRLGRRLSATRDEAGVLVALREGLSPLMPVDEVQLVVPERGRFRVLRAGPEGVEESWTGLTAGRHRRDRAVLVSGRALADGELPGPQRSGAWLPVVEEGRTRAVVSLWAAVPDAYREPLLAFLARVADLLGLALRNAWSYQRLEAQRRRLEVAEAVGRRLISCLDVPSILVALREELASQLEFEALSLHLVGEEGLADGYLAGAGGVRRLDSDLPGPARQALARGRAVQLRGPHGPAGPEGVEVWVPVRQHQRVAALLSLRACRPALDGWHRRLLEDLAVHVGLALANADNFQAAQRERHRLEVLHRLELKVAVAADERQIAEAVASVLHPAVSAELLVVAYLNDEGLITGYCSEPGRLRQLAPAPISHTRFFERLRRERATIVEAVPAELRQPRPSEGWPTWGPLIPARVVTVPLWTEDRVTGALSAQRIEDQPFEEDEVRLLESAAPMVDIALRSAWLRRANQQALERTVVVQQVSGLAGQDLGAVVASVAEQTRSLLGAAGAACWAFDPEGRISARAVAGRREALRILDWAGGPPSTVVQGRRGELSWGVGPIRYADRVVGAIGLLRRPAAAKPPPSITEFGRHAAIAIENARLAGEARARIRVLEAVAGFADLDLEDAGRAHLAMARLLAEALPGGALWLRSGPDLVRIAGEGRIPVRRAATALRRNRLPLRLLGGPRGTLPAAPIMARGRLEGMVTADAGPDTDRLLAVLAGQASQALGRLELVAALDREARTREEILKHSPVGVILEDEEGRVAYANPEIERIYGLGLDQVVGRPAHRLLERPRVKVLPNPEAGPGITELRLEQRGTTVQVRRVAIPGAEKARVLSLHQDVTQERQLLEAKDLMLRAIGHEVRSPAAAMRSTIAGLLQWGAVMDAEHRRELILEAYEQAGRLLSLVENQLLIAKLETWRFTPNPSAVPLARSLEQAVAVLRDRHGDRVEAVQDLLPPDLPPAWCEPTHLDQVLTNLIGNALEHTSARWVRVQASARRGWLEVTVADDGRGLPPERASSAFTKAAPAGRNRSKGGLGLGLYLCRLVVERSFGGRIWVASTGPQGTVFKFTVPAAPARSRVP
jgi:PAS domain S-box-containing protein